MFLRQHTRPLEIKLLTHFYRAIHQGLCSNKEAIIYEIITSARNIFSINLPGANVLIGDFLREIDRLFNSALLQNIPPEIEKQALAIAISLICYPDHLDAVEFPVISVGDNLNITGPQSKLTSADMKMKISSILLAALTRENTPVKLTCLWGIVVLLCQELQQVQVAGPVSTPNSPVTGKGPRKDIISSFVTELLNHSIHQNTEVSQAALDGLSTLALQYDRLFKLDPSIISNIISTLCNNIIGIITKTKIITTNNSVSESIVSNHFYCLIEWVMSSSSIGNINMLKDPDTALKVFTAIEVGLFGDYVKERLEKTGNEKKDKKDKKMVSSGSVGDLSSLKASAVAKFVQKREETLYSQLRAKPIHGSDLIREAAEALLYYTRFHFHNFPCPGQAGPEQLSSLLSEDDSSTNDQKFVSFIYNDNSIVSIGQLPDSSNSATTTRVIVRDATGKYAWDAKISYDMALAALKGKLNVEIEMPNVSSSPPTAKSSSTSKDYKRKKGEIPLYSSYSQSPSIPSNDDSNSPDILNELLG